MAKKTAALALALLFVFAVFSGCTANPGGAATTAARKQLLLEQRRQIVSRIDELNSALNRLDWKLDSYEERMLKCEENLVNFSESSKPVESTRN